MDTDFLAAALRGYQQRLVTNKAKINEIQRRLGGQPAAAPALEDAAPTPARRKMSAAGRARIAAAQRKRWAIQRAADAIAAGAVAAPVTRRRRRKLKVHSATV